MDEYIETGAASFMGVTGSPSVTDAFTFTYGTPFRVTTRLMANAWSDNQYLYTDFNPYFAHYGGGTACEITVDFMNTATLNTIAIPTSDGSTQLATESGADHQSFIGTTIVPEPTMVALFALSIPFLSRRYSRWRGAT